MMTAQEFDAFVAEGPSRETSPSIMEAIATVATDAWDANQIWEEGMAGWSKSQVFSFMNDATEHGWIDVADLVWGASRGVEIVPQEFRAEFERD